MDTLGIEFGDKSEELQEKVRYHFQFYTFTGIATARKEISSRI